MKSARRIAVIRIAVILATLFAIGAALPLLADASLHFGPPIQVSGGFLRPFGVAVDETNGRLLVADTGNHRFQWAPIADIVAGTYTFTPVGFLADRNDPNALTHPQAIAVDAAGNVFVVNTLRGEVQAFTFSGGGYTIDPSFCSTNRHTVDGVDLLMPRDIAVGSDGAIYLLDSGNERILKATGAGATAWTVFASDPAWSNPYGFDITDSGDLYIADTGNHRIVRLSGGTSTIIGQWGRGAAQFRYPRDVVVDQYGRILVADTFNHRVQVLAADGHELVEMGHAPSMSTIDKIAIDSSDRVFVADSDTNRIVAFLGAGVPAPFDPFIRDFTGDNGDEPSDASSIVSSPDILVRHQPDVDLVAAAASGLETIAFQQPVYDRLNYVYVALHNRGTQQALDNIVRLYWFDPSGAAVFPADWSEEGFFKAWSDATHNTPSNTLLVPVVEASGVTVAGPILWRPPAPESAIGGDGRFRLAVRVTNPYDFPPSGAPSTVTRDSNNVTERRVQVLRTPPFGDQNTLVVMANYPDIASVIDQDALTTKLDALKTWFEETSWGAAKLTYATVGPIPLPHNRAHYADPSNALIVEMTQDVLDALAPANPTILDGSGPGHEITRIILVTNDLSDNTDWATTGTWPFTFLGETRYLTTSVQGGNNAMPQFAHGVSHQLGMLDLFAHENVTFDRPHADRWDNMAKPFEGAHPLVWSKELSYWASSHGAKVLFVPRPHGGSTWNNGGQPVRIRFQETAAPGDTIAVAFGLTEGVTVFTDETAFYYVEARKNTGGAGATFDTVVPETGVVMYYANSQIPQGQGPVILRDDVPGGTLDDAAIPVGGNESPLGTGISVSVQQGTQGADFDLVVAYSPPATDYDVYLHPGDPPWESPDIWVDNQTDGYDEVNGDPPQDRGNQGIAGEENRVYGRVFNHGPAAAYDVEAMFMFSEPYHTVDGHDAFDEYMSRFVDQVDPSADVPVFVNWTPKTGIDPHTCGRVELRRLFDDTNSANDAAQRNLDIDHSKHGSPYTPVEFPVFVRNEQPKAEVVYFRADGIPDGWTWGFTPRKQLVQPGAMAEAKLVLKPPDTARDCTSHKIRVTSWAPRGDTMVRLGGATVTVNLVAKTAIDIKVGLGECRKEDLRPKKPAGGDEKENAKIVTTEAVVTGPRNKPVTVRKPILDEREEQALDAATTLLASDEPARTENTRDCVRIVVHGCTTPPQPNTEIVVRYKDEHGQPHYQTVTTDAAGCYEDFFVTTEGGAWQVDATFGGNDCEAPATATGEIDVPLPVRPEEDPGIDPTTTFCTENVEAEVKGQVKHTATGVPGNRECKIDVRELELRLEVHARNGGSVGEIFISDLREIIDLGSKSGLRIGRFEWKSSEGLFAGSVTGLMRVDGKPWLLSMDATRIEGPAAGARLRGELTLTFDHDDASGALIAIVETRCDLSKEARQKVIEAAREAAKRRTTFCDGAPCLEALAKDGIGKTILDGTRKSSCKECRASMTIRRLIARLSGTDVALKDGFLVVPELVQVTGAKTQRDEIGGRFAYLAGDGVRVKGLLWGMAEGGKAEGDLFGIVGNGPRRGARVYARWRMEVTEERGRRQSVRMRIAGWVLLECSTPLRVVREAEVVRTPTVEPRPSKPAREPRAQTPLPDKYFRPLDQLPREAVESVRKAEGGTLSDAAVRKLRLGDRRFRALDRNGDQWLSAEELTQLASNKPDARMLQAVVDNYLRQYDRNKDRKITRVEAGRSWEGLAILDADRNGSLTPAELAESPSKLTPAARFRAIDRDHDGHITFPEFALWWREVPSVADVIPK